MKCLSHQKYYARKKPNTACITCWQLWEWSLFVDWAIHEGITHKTLYTEYSKGAIQSRNAIVSLSSAIEKDMYCGKAEFK
jgi:hypothetical protein